MLPPSAAAQAPPVWPGYWGTHSLPQQQWQAHASPFLCHPACSPSPPPIPPNRWFGWYGFNPGSTGAILGNAVRYPAGGFSQIAAAVAINTTVRG